MSNEADIFSKLIDAQEVHNNFLSATQKNIGYYFFGKDASVIKDDFTFPVMDLVSCITGLTPKAFNIYSMLISSFIDEISNSKMSCEVSPYPVKGREPYEAYADQLEEYLGTVHTLSKRDTFMRAIVFEILSHSFFVLYTDGQKYWPLSGYDYIPADQSIRDPQAQPFHVRRTYPTKAALLKSLNGKIFSAGAQAILDRMSDLDKIPIYDTWVKDLDLNIGFMSSGDIVYEQAFRTPKRYPFFVGNDSDLINSFYNTPPMSNMRDLQDKYDAALCNIEENGKSIGNPILTYDSDSGIDATKLKRALKEGYKRIILGKHKEGDLKFHVPGTLPDYVQKFPQVIEDLMMRNLGITGAFFGTLSVGARERGAISNLIKTSFRRLASVSSIIETTFSELDTYLIEYAQTHQLIMRQQLKMRSLEEVFQPGVYYTSKEKFSDFSTEDTMEAKNLAMAKYRSNLISQETALRELGYKHPRRIIDQQAKEKNEQAKDQNAVRNMMNAPVTPNTAGEIFDRLKGNLKFRFYVLPINADMSKFVVKCAAEDLKTVAFLLADLSSSVMVAEIEAQPTPPGGDVPPTPPAPPTPPQPERPVGPAAPSSPTEGPSKPAAPESTPAPQPLAIRRPEPIANPFVKAPVAVPNSALAPEPGLETVPAPEAKAEVAAETGDAPGGKLFQQAAAAKAKQSGFSEERLKNLVLRSVPLKNPEKFLNLPGLYLVEPFAADIYSKRKSLIIFSSKMPKLLGKPYLLCGKKVYGVIIIKEIVDNYDFAATRKYHLVTDQQRKKWWGDKQTYLYMFEFHPFPETYDYQIPPGVQMIIRPPVKIKPKVVLENIKSEEPVSKVVPIQ